MGWAVLVTELTWSAYVLACVLLVLGLLHAWQRREAPAAARPGPISILLVVRDHEDEIEAFMRPLLAGCGGGSPRLEYELVVVDAGSRDDTWAILSRLARCRPGIRAMRWQDGHGFDPFQAGRLICRYPVTVTIDLTTGAGLQPARRTLAWLIHDAGSWGPGDGHGRQEMPSPPRRGASCGPSSGN